MYADTNPTPHNPRAVFSRQPHVLSVRSTQSAVMTRVNKYLENCLPHRLHLRRGTRQITLIIRSTGLLRHLVNQPPEWLRHVFSLPRGGVLNELGESRTPTPTQDPFMSKRKGKRRMHFLHRAHTRRAPAGQHPLISPPRRCRLEIARLYAASDKHPELVPSRRQWHCLFVTLN